MAFNVTDGFQVSRRPPRKVACREKMGVSTLFLVDSFVDEGFQIWDGSLD